MCALTQQSQQQPRDTYFYLDFTMASRRLKYEGASYWLLKYSLVALLLQVSHSLSSPEGECYRNGATFVGLSLSRWSNSGNQDTVTRQVQFDFCEIIDRNETYVQSLNDDGWLVCGGQSSNDPTNKITAADSAHIEIVHTGVTSDELGGMQVNEIIDAVYATPFAPLKVKPLKLQLNNDSPPELELRFEADNTSAIWQFYTQLLANTNRPCTEEGSPFHMTIARKVAFRSEELMNEFLQKGNEIVQTWRQEYPDGVALGTEDIGYGHAYLFLNRNEIVYEFKPTLHSS